MFYHYSRGFGWSKVSHFQTHGKKIEFIYVRFLEARESKNTDWFSEKKLLPSNLLHSSLNMKNLIATWCNTIGISHSIRLIINMECLDMSERVYQLEFTIKYNIWHVYLIGWNFIFGGKIRFSMSNMEWRWLEGKSFFSKINLSF